ncbi:MAG TPA: hypothetical protein VHV30_07280 [Polyangiaceae bacterium]|jgi:hypothetical protein|nr:hypothetical protein [Polyangiaceae bacterium]
MAATAAVITAALGCAGCKGGPADPPGPSPQAAAEPAPFANPPSASTASISRDAGPPPEPLRSDQALAADVPRELATREAGAPRDSRELSGYALQAIMRTGEGPLPLRAAEVNSPAIDAARRRAETRLVIEMSSARARFVVSGAGLVVAAGTELRARADRYGHLLLWPGEDTYRIAEPGALRALFAERRLDVAPVARGDVNDAGEGARRLNMRTRRVEVATRAAKATFELGTLHDADSGGTLICRLLLDLMSASPATAACDADEVPLHVELRWTTQGALNFDVVSIARRADLSAQELEAPPPALAFVAGPPPQSPAETLVARNELAAFRTVPIDVPAAPLHEGQDPIGMTLVNSTDEVRVVWLDGVPVAWVGPGARVVLPSLTRGRYVIQWRTYLGDSWEPPATVVVPGYSEVGGAKVAAP